MWGHQHSIATISVTPPPPFNREIQLLVFAFQEFLIFQTVLHLVPLNYLTDLSEGGGGGSP